MAKTLRANGHAKEGDNGPAPLTEDEFLAFFTELDEAESQLASALAACKAPRKAIKDIKGRIGERMDLDAFERAVADRLKPGFKREQEDREYRQMMAWFGKPIGTQAAFDFAVKNPTVGELKTIDTEGFTAGRAGHAPDCNTYSPGDERFARFENAYKRGFDEFMVEQKERAEKLGGDEEPNRRGRPPGPSKKAASPTDGRRGRIISEEQKAAMKAGRDRKRQEAAAAAAR